MYKPQLGVIRSALALLLVSGVMPTMSGSLAAQTLATVPAPTFSPRSGSYDTQLQVSLRDSDTPSAVVYYTTDGSTPSATNGMQYSGAITVAASETIKAVAVTQQIPVSSSSVASATYVIHLPTEPPLSRGKWEWNSGGDTLTGYCNVPREVGLPGVYGSLGVAAPDNVPGSRRGALRWTGKDGDLWLFGGFGFAAAPDCAELNDLWRFHPATHLWTWMGGSSAPTYSQAGVYGKLGTFSPGNAPGSRDGAVTWTDENGKLWLFGGFGFDSSDTAGEFNDLWVFDPSLRQWAWMGGSSIEGEPGVYGMRGQADTNNVPGARYGAVSWLDRSGNFWLLGGYGYDRTGTFGFLNDLWEYSPSARAWTWISGSRRANAKGTYGKLQQADAANTPGARLQGVSWIDNNGDFWLFGGDGYGSAGNGYLNDLWTFHPSTQQWIWMGGSKNVGTNISPYPPGQSGVYGTLGTPTPGNIPGSRYQATAWTDEEGNLWLFGGVGYDSLGSANLLNDLWEFQPVTLLWTWMGGSNTVSETSEPGVYGKFRVPSTANVPGSRRLAVSWTGSGGNLWLFGGDGRDSVGVLGELNDPLRYKLPPSDKKPH